MKCLKQLLLVLALVAIPVLFIPWAWLNYYHSDLPDVHSLAAYLPDTETEIRTSICDTPTNIKAIPSLEMSSLIPALYAAEGEPDKRGVLRREFDDTTSDMVRRKYGHYSLEIARQLNCNSGGNNLSREIREIRIAIQLERRFKPDQLITIYLNRVSMGSGLNGVETASSAYFGKHTSQLSVAETAALVGLIRSPNYYSPLRHPERAMGRRNEIIDTMLRRGSLTPDQANQAKTVPIEILPNK